MHLLSNKCHLEIDQNGNSYSEYVGITFDKGCLNIVFPRGYKLSESDRELRNDVLLLIKAFDKYAKSKQTKAYSEDEKNLTMGKGEKFSLINAIWFLNDYERNGLYKEYDSQYKTDKKGTIHWAKTIKSITPYANNEKLIYLDYIVKEENNDINNIVFLIQKYIVEKCIDIIGWLYPSIKIDGFNRLPYKRHICINLLKKKLRLVNNDKIRILIVNMVNFLENDGDEEGFKSLKEYKTMYFRHIWEHMLDSILGNEDPSDYYPKASWHIDGSNTYASNLEPDTILRSLIDDKVYVIDAKYYKYGITGSISHLPQSSDITKQMLYSEYIKTNKGNDTYDAFILPYESRSQDTFKFIGHAKININAFEQKKVVCILADIKTIIERYVFGNKLSESKEDVIKIIDENN